MMNERKNGGSKFASGFIKYIDKYQTLEDFEVRWQELVSHHGVQHKKGAIDLYNNKEKSAKIFLCEYFFACM